VNPEVGDQPGRPVSSQAATATERRADIFGRLRSC
jgi:hypothetical protein